MNTTTVGTDKLTYELAQDFPRLPDGESFAVGQHRRHRFAGQALCIPEEGPARRGIRQRRQLPGRVGTWRIQFTARLEHQR